MSVEIPIPADTPHFTERVTLDGAAYTLEFRWNEREASWRFSLGTADGTPIAVGLKVRPSYVLSLGWRIADARRPPGVFAVIDTSGANAPPGLNDLGNRVRVVYFTADEMASR
jgi:hypothetical protein